jgi:hypothetical protein
MQRLGRATAHEGDDPVHDRRQDRRDAPEHQPDEMWECEQQPEEDREARAAAVVVHLDADR